MNRILLLLSIFLLHAQCSFSQPPTGAAEIIPGANRMTEYLPLLKGKRVALLVNQTSLIGDTHLVDTLQACGIEVVKVFAPEHGFRGNAADGETISDGVDIRSGLPIVSLYGSHRKPTPEDLQDVDIVVFDIQDVGTRFYTYISSMSNLMEACAEQDKTLMILDRPNPNGKYVDGPIMEKPYMSFVGMHPIPILHGMTVGELAGMINKEGWLANKVICNLVVILMQHYSHDRPYALPMWTSPNLPNDLAVELYPSLCLFEGTVISVGRGTYKPFQQIGNPLFKGKFEYSFTPVSIKGMSVYPPLEGETCYGTLFTEENAVHGLDLSYLIQYYKLYPKKEEFFNEYFKKLAGTEQLQKQIEAGMSEEEIRKTWQPGLKQFRAKREQYLLYP